MPFKIFFTYQAQKRILTCLAITALILFFCAGFAAWLPSLFRIGLGIFLFLCLASFIPRHCKWNKLIGLFALFLFMLHRTLTPFVNQFISAKVPAVTANDGKNAAHIISHHFLTVQETIIHTGQAIAQKTWLKTGEVIAALASTIIIWWLFPALRRQLVRHAPNSSYQWWEMILSRLPRRLTRYIRSECCLAAMMVIPWSLAWSLLDFRYPVLLGILSSIGYWTPYFGNSLASLFALVFTIDVRSLPTQIAGVIMASALFWLIKYYVCDNLLSKSRPAVATGMVLILILTALGVTGFWSVFFILPLCSISLLFAWTMEEASPLLIKFKFIPPCR